MIDAFVEGVRSLSQVCHLVIVVPVALTILAARGRWQGAVGAIAGVVVGGWIFAAGWVDVTDARLRVSAVAVAAVVAALWFATSERPNVPERLRSPWAIAAASAGVALIVTHWWRPCVGVELGQILTNTPSEPFRQLPAAAGFMLGVAIPVVLLSLAFVAVRPTPGALTKVSLGGTIVFVLLAASVVAGQHGEIVSRLFQWSQ